MSFPRLLPLVLLTLALMAILNWIGAPLITSEAPYGVISYELARTPQITDAILSSWDGDARLHAAFSLGLDYLFMVAYAAAISSACLQAGRFLQGSRWPLAGLARPLAWGAWIAALFDAVENVALAISLFRGAAVVPWPEIAYLCAVLKFALVFLGLVYTFYAVAVYLVSRLLGQSYRKA